MEKKKKNAGGKKKRKVFGKTSLKEKSWASFDSIFIR